MASPERPTPEGFVETIRAETMLTRFKRICKENPVPSYKPAELEGATEEELKYLVQNDAGEIFLSSKALWNITSETRPIIQSALQKALQFAYQINGLEMPDYTAPPPESDPNHVTSFRASLGLPEWKPMQKYNNFSWATSESKKLFDEFHAENARIQAECEAKEAAQTAAISELVSPRTPRTPSEPFREDPVVWAAQEEAVASSVLRELRSRGKKSLWGSRSTKLKPEAAAEMARARVAAAAAAAVMRDVNQGAQLVLANVIDTDEVFERMRTGAKDAETGVSSMHAQAFKRAMSLGSGTKARGKRRVAFAEDTVFGNGK